MSRRHSSSGGSSSLGYLFGSEEAPKQERDRERSSRKLSLSGRSSSLGYLFGSGEASKQVRDNERVSRRLSLGGRPSSVGYLFGSGEAPKEVVKKGPAKIQPKPAVPKPVVITKQSSAGLKNTSVNNYMRLDGQNKDNFLTERPTKKVLSVPGGDSSLDYLFGGGSK